MKYAKDFTTRVSSLVKSEEIKKYREQEQNFKRKRKMGIQEVIYYLLNKKGLSNKMEIFKFNNLIDVKSISAPGVLKQREKLNPEVFIYLKDEGLKLLYENHKSEVKTCKGYLLIGIDGTDLEIPNNKITRERYNGKWEDNACARLTMSVMYDLLNRNTLDTIVEEYNYFEQIMAKEHLKNIDGKLGEYPIIRVLDRGYASLDNIYDSGKNDKFVVRLPINHFKKEIQLMKSNDEIIEIGYEYNRAKGYKEKNPELYNYLFEGNKIKCRILKIVLSTGEVEILLTNLDETEFSYEEIKEIYKLRWNIETNYSFIKDNLKIEAITSSKDLLIKQDIHSSILVFNMIQAYINESNEKINQEKYKNKMKINVNMAIGLFKDAFILVLLESNERKRSKMMEELENAMQKYIVPIKPGRNPQRKTNPKNKYHINKRKSF